MMVWTRVLQYGKEMTKKKLCQTYKILSVMDTLDRVWLLTVSFREHQLKLIGGQFRVKKMKLVLRVMLKRTVDPLIKGDNRNQVCVQNQGEIRQVCRKENH